MSKNDQKQLSNPNLMNCEQTHSPHSKAEPGIKNVNDKQSKSRKRIPPPSNQSQPSRKLKPPSNQNSLITSYFRTVEHPPEEISKSNNIKQSASNMRSLEKEVEKREMEKEALLKQQAEMIEEGNRKDYQYEKFKKRYNEIVTNSLQKTYASKRKNRLKEKSSIGSLLEKQHRIEFVEGPDFLKVRLKKSENDQALYDVLKQLSDPSKGALQRAGLGFGLKRLEKQHQQLVESLAELEDRKDEFMRLANLVKMEQSCHFAKKLWPVIQNRYITLQLLGKGGFSQVYKCFDLEMADYVALKLTYPDESLSLETKNNLINRIHREYDTQKGLDHPNIARLFNEVDMNDRWTFALTLQLCEGPELSEYMKRNKFIEEEQAKYIVKQILNALQYMSSRGVVHYDLKPRNIMFHKGVVKVLDFGLCKILEDDQTRKDLSSPGAGTYWYLPPQTFQGSPTISRKVDIWSLGVIFYEMLFGKRPYGDGMSQKRIMKQKIILNASQVQYPDNQRSRKISKGAKQFIQRCLVYDENERISVEEANRCQYMQEF